LPQGGIATAATIHGKDLAAPITLRGNAEPCGGTDLAILVQHGGLLAAMFQQAGLVPTPQAVTSAPATPSPT
jgi:hypothetical protein